MSAERLRIRLVTPASPSSPTGNGVTARRWARILRDLGHRVVVERSYERGTADVLVALHARRSAGSIERFKDRHPEAPVVLALTGTDVYSDIHTDESARRSLEVAACYVVLQPLAAEQLPDGLRRRVHVIYQSAVAPPGPPPTPRPDVFEAVLLAHLRPVKDPMRAALATRLLPPSSTVHVVHAGRPLEAGDERIAAEAEAETATNPRYRWVGPLPRWKAMRLLARSRLLVLTSVDEGGANVISEALACSVPIVSSEIPGSVGLLGSDYPGYFPVGDEYALAAMLHEAETSTTFYADLSKRCAALAPLFNPAQERQSWDALLCSL